MWVARHPQNAQIHQEWAIGHSTRHFDEKNKGIGLPHIWLLFKSMVLKTLLTSKKEKDRLANKGRVMFQLPITSSIKIINHQYTNNLLLNTNQHQPPNNIH